MRVSFLLMELPCLFQNERPNFITQSYLRLLLFYAMPLYRGSEGVSNNRCSDELSKGK